MLYYLQKWFLHNKIQAILLMVIGIITITSLITYSQEDPSFNLVTHKYPSNFCKYFGSYLSDLLYQFLGLSSFLPALACIIWAIILYRTGELPWFAARFMVIIVASIGFSISCSNLKIKRLPADGGGAIGIMLHPLISEYGLIADIILFLLSITLFFTCLGINSRTYLAIFTKLTSIFSVFAKISKKYINKLKFSKTIKPAIIRQAPAITNNEIEYLQSAKEEEAPLASYHTVPRTKTKSVSESKTANLSTTIPPIDLLKNPDNQQIRTETKAELKQNAENLLKVLGDFGVKGQIIDISQGPVVTLYEFEPAAGTKSSRVIGLSDDIARSLSAISTRIAVIPGRNVLGIELPNKQRAFFCLRELIETAEYQDSNISLPLVLGKDLAGKPFIADLAKMPHLLVAGTTGSGKSVAINAMIMSLLYRYTPEECRLIMIDPKMLELSVYDNIPHLLTPVVTEPGKAVVALKWAVKEMENRYRLMSNVGVRNISGYNAKIIEAIKAGKTLERTVQVGFDPETGVPIYESIAINMEKLPFIVVIVDEMADLMLVAGKDIESSIQRLAQMARAAGIHIIMATQRPSVDVITGVIKANFPSRISFKVTSKIDSRTILGEQGAEQLLGLGDLLYMGNAARITRVHGPFVDDSEVEKVAEYLRAAGTPEYISAVTALADEDVVEAEEVNLNGSDNESMYKKAVQIVRLERKVSTSYIQRCLRIGYNRAADIIDRMEREGIIAAPNHAGKREILLPEE
ncbi:DNA translocase FtsK [Candidatus Trichorickettsia mobilis]|uniref:DNA translocase FtsK n=1 Tax=Candidatus Trichorickettsia mobilis TaxID=1346319 RepID=A0ABZ0UVA0_9RICK|nr:DNA translocase FtsK 4TM domain-containing protein [Candidatus Trichorickettsia mobilis]WPY00893.1 DNA translocase FtsK [Candidatus Trichorickettsia mobilis]